jgi:hypothetical protein
MSTAACERRSFLDSSLILAESRALAGGAP